MAFTRLRQSGSPFTLCLILVLGIAFLAPLYHSHAHAGGSHHHDDYDHVLLPDDSSHEKISDPQQNSTHLHIKKKDIARTDTHPNLSGKLRKTGVCGAAASPVLPGLLMYTRSKRAETLVFQSILFGCLSGLSPPTA